MAMTVNVLKHRLSNQFMGLRLHRRLSENREPTAEKLILASFSHYFR